MSLCIPGLNLVKPSTKISRKEKQSELITLLDQYQVTNISQTVECTFFEDTSAPEQIRSSEKFSHEIKVNDKKNIKNNKKALYNQVMVGNLSKNRSYFYSKITRSQLYALYSIAKKFDKTTEINTVKELESWCKKFFNEIPDITKLELNENCAKYFAEIDGNASKAGGYDLDKIRSYLPAKYQKLSKQEVIDNLKTIIISSQKLNQQNEKNISEGIGLSEEEKHKYVNPLVDDYNILRSIVLNNLEVLCHNQNFLSRNLTNNLPHALVNAILILVKHNPKIANFDEVTLDKQKKLCASELSDLIILYLQKSSKHKNQEIIQAFIIAKQLGSDPQAYTHFEEFIQAGNKQLDSRYYCYTPKVVQTSDSELFKKLTTLLEIKTEKFSILLDKAYQLFLLNQPFEKIREELNGTFNSFSNDLKKLSALAAKSDNFNLVYQQYGMQKQKLSNKLEMINMPDSLEKLQDIIKSLNEGNEEEVSFNFSNLQKLKAEIDKYKHILTEFEREPSFTSYANYEFLKGVIEQIEVDINNLFNKLNSISIEIDEILVSNSHTDNTPEAQASNSLINRQTSLVQERVLSEDSLIVQQADIDKQINYLKTMLNREAQVKFEYLLNLKKVYGTGNLVAAKICSGDTDGSTGRAILLGIQAGIISLDEESLLQLTFVLNEEAKILVSCDFANYQTNKKIQGYLAAIVEKAIFKASLIPLVFIGDVAHDRFSCNKDADKKIREKLHECGAILIYGNHDSIDESKLLGLQGGLNAKNTISDSSWREHEKLIFINAYLDEAANHLYIHNGLKQISENTFLTVFGEITASSAKDLVEQINIREAKLTPLSNFNDSTSFTNFRPEDIAPYGILKDFIIIHGHTGSYSIKTKGVINLNPRRNNKPLPIAHIIT